MDIEMFDFDSIRPSEAVQDRNLNRATKGEGYRCMSCCLPIDENSPKTVWVHMSGHGKLYPNTVSCEDAEKMPEGSMYMHPVGPECAKKIPANYK